MQNRLNYEGEELLNKNSIFRENLALDRTVLANERTFLSYVRTTLAFVAAGVSALHFFDALILKMIAVVFIAAGLMTFIFGVKKYRHIQFLISERKR